MVKVIFRLNFKVIVKLYMLQSCYYLRNGERNKEITKARQKNYDNFTISITLVHLYQLRLWHTEFENDFLTKAECYCDHFRRVLWLKHLVYKMLFLRVCFLLCFLKLSDDNEILNGCKAGGPKPSISEDVKCDFTESF